MEYDIDCLLYFLIDVAGYNATFTTTITKNQRQKGLNIHNKYAGIVLFMFQVIGYNFEIKPVFIEKKKRTGFRRNLTELLA
jgi:hypothetical protein